VKREIGFPVVLKVESPDIPHKTEAGGVHLDLSTEDHVREGFDAIVAIGGLSSFPDPSSEA
jgi:acyl-CoA synthetase (NDP forming)